MIRGSRFRARRSHFPSIVQTSREAARPPGVHRVLSSPSLRLRPIPSFSPSITTRCCLQSPATTTGCAALCSPLTGSVLPNWACLEHGGRAGGAAEWKLEARDIGRTPQKSNLARSRRPGRGREPGQQDVAPHSTNRLGCASLSPDLLEDGAQHGRFEESRGLRKEKLCLQPTNAEYFLRPAVSAAQDCRPGLPATGNSLCYAVWRCWWWVSSCIVILVVAMDDVPGLRHLIWLLLLCCAHFDLLCQVMHSWHFLEKYSMSMLELTM